MRKTKTGKRTRGAGDDTSLRAEWVGGARTVEFPKRTVRFVTDVEYRRVMKARGFDPDTDLQEFMDAEDFTGAIRVKIGGASGMLCTL